MNCKNCSKPIVDTGNIVPALKWIHADLYFSCDGRCGHGEKFAAPTAPNASSTRTPQDGCDGP